MSDPFSPAPVAGSELPEIDARQGRTYIHADCGGATNVTGRDLVGLCNPFEIVMGTVCVHCGVPESTKNFVWQDTGENVAKYRQRGVTQMPLLAVLSWLVLPGIGGVIGALIGSNIQGAFGPLTNVGAAGGVLLMFLFLGPILVRAVASKRILNRDRDAAVRRS